MFNLLGCYNNMERKSHFIPKGCRLQVRSNMKEPSSARIPSILINAPMRRRETAKAPNLDPISTFFRHLSRLQAGIAKNPQLQAPSGLGVLVSACRTYSAHLKANSASRYPPTTPDPYNPVLFNCVQNTLLVKFFLSKHRKLQRCQRGPEEKHVVWADYVGITYDQRVKTNIEEQKRNTLKKNREEKQK